VVAGLAAGGFLPGCGPEAARPPQADAPESKAGESNPSKPQPAVRLPKNVNPNASNKGIKGKYAD
jgi:hypothetical protein